VSVEKPHRKKVGARSIPVLVQERFPVTAKQTSKQILNFGKKQATMTIKMDLSFGRSDKKVNLTLAQEE
jgi:hypothetical protein